MVLVFLCLAYFTLMPEKKSIKRQLKNTSNEMIVLGRMESRQNQRLFSW